MSGSVKPYLTSNEVAALLMVAPGTVRMWTDKGLLHAQTTLGGHRRFLRSEVERFMRERQQLASTPLRVLIVDDDPAFVRYLVALLGGIEGKPVEIATAHDGFEAGHLLHQFAPDVILLDLIMPGLDGYQVCRQIRQDPATSKVRIVAMTGDASPANVERALCVGAEECLAKPLDDDRLLALLGFQPASP